MFSRSIIVEKDKSYIDLVATIVGEDEQEVLADTDKRFKELVKQHEPTLSEEEILDITGEGFFYQKNDEGEIGLYIFKPNFIYQV